MRLLDGKITYMVIIMYYFSHLRKNIKLHGLIINRQLLAQVDSNDKNTFDYVPGRIAKTANRTDGS